MLLITPSLLSSFRYYFDYEGEKEAAVRGDFIRTLSRLRSEPTEAMQTGIDFENAISAYCEGAQPETEVIKEIGDIVKGGMWQLAVKKEMDNFLLYARADVVKADTIYDIKYTGTYDIGKFQKSMQHRIEFYCTDLPKFSYLVSNERDYWREDYFNHAGIEGEIRQALREFTGYLENDAEAKELFYSKWKSL